MTKPWTMVTKQPHYVNHVKNNVEKKKRLITCDHAIVDDIIDISNSIRDFEKLKLYMTKMITSQILKSEKKVAKWFYKANYKI